MSLPGIDMNGIHPNGKNHNFEKPYPGCLGRMVNLFELNLGVSANKLLTDKPHRDGSPLSRSRSDVSRMSPSPELIQEEVIVPEFKKSSSSRKSNAMPMKMLIAQEMSKDLDSRRSPPNLVAKLMGLDTLPRQEPDSAVQRSHCRGHPRSHSDIPLSYWEQQNGFFHYVEPNEYKDVHEIMQQSQKSTHKGRCDEFNKKMALVRQNFDEAKRLSMDVKLRQSKKFHDALEVLNSNKDLFIKCLQEPNKMFSERLYNLHSAPPPSEAKRITVLRPSKTPDSGKSAGAGNKDEKQMKRSASVQLNWSEKNRLGSSPPSTWKDYENPTQPTRIVVLKPSPGKFHDLKAVSTPQSESPRILHGEDFFGDVDDDENQESREVAKTITQQMREKLGRHRRDETLISSVFSNGYVGDESSFNKSEIDYEACNLSDSEAISPVSRHSWDYVNRLGSPYSSSSLSRASYSPESSVCREAKKRLSERWATIASGGGGQEKRHVRRNSSTLGEMLALSEAKKAAMPGEEGISNEASKKAAMPGEEGISNEESKDLNSSLVGEQRTDEIADSSPRDLMRSKSVPMSSTEFGSRVNVDTSLLDKGKPEAPREEAKDRNSKSSFKGKVSSLFFSRSKKPSKDKSLASDIKNEFESSPGQMSSNRSESVGSKGPNHLSLGFMETSSKASFSNLIGKHGMASLATGNSGENQDQPSPISVLDIPLEEDILLPHYVRPDRQGVDLSHNALRSNLIDKSPPIGSISRTLPWEDSCMDTASSYSAKESSATQRKEEEEEWFFFVKTLLSVSGIQRDMRSNSFLASWHSPESPLDPSLRDKYIDLKDRETLHEAKRRQKRSMRKLVFDFVNVVLVETAARLGSDVVQIGIGVNISPLDNSSSTILDEVWARMSVWVSGEARCVSDDYEDDNSLVVERLVRNEVVGNGWIHQSRLEMDNLRKEIEVELLEELVQETVAELTGRT